MYQFEYHKSSSVEDAINKLKSSEDGKILAGGMTLLPTMKQRLASPSDLIDLGDIKELNGINFENDKLIIKSMTTHYNVHSSNEVINNIPSLSKLAGLIGDPMVRHRGTIGGSIANSDPSADYPSAVIALNATIVTNLRQINSDDYFKGLFETELEEDELITEIHFPKPLNAAYAKFPQPASRYALVGVYFANTKNGIRVGVTGAGACAFRCKEIEEALTKSLAVDSLNDIKIDPTDLNSDIHGSAEYRAHLITVMAKRAVKEALEN
ncbi:xanthine dehydrogenase family protein subunit M [Alphaproteobacteria bacterium]|nr:xanthine dehydrogenase family protein subunit M [Alphaproteobacteria bacterium]